MRLADAASKLIVLLNKYDVPLNDKLNQLKSVLVKISCYAWMMKGLCENAE